MSFKGSQSGPKAECVTIGQSADKPRRLFRHDESRSQLKLKGFIVDNNQRALNITHGMDVVGADGDKIGEVSGIEGEYIIVVKGFFFPSDHYIPLSAVNTVDDKVYLNVTKDAALNQGWETAPETSMAAFSSGQATAAQGDQATDTAYVDEAVTDSTYVDEQVDDTIRRDHADVNTSDSLRVELAEEELTARTRGVERGAVHVDKVITEEQQTLDVPVTEERVTIDRRVVDRDVAPGDATFEEGTIEVRLRGEEVEIEKRARVREEIEIGKEQVTTSERVTDTVRREEARISSDADTVVEDIDTIDETDRPVR